MCDSVVNFEVVLASGYLVNANSTSHPDLYRALRGGLNNFGVVTRFDFKTLPIGQILAGNIAHDISRRNQVFDAFVTIANAPVYNVHASIVTSLTSSSDKKAWTLSSTPIYTKPELDPPVYKELFAVPNITNNMRLKELHTLANETAPPQIEFLFFTGTYDVSTKLLSGIFNISNNTFYDSEAGTTWLVTFEPLPTVIVSRGAGKNSLGTSASDGNGMVFLLTAIWTNQTYSASVQSRATTVMSSINSAAKEMGMLHRFQSANYANRKQKVIESYGTKNKAFLLDVAKRYDPLGVFQNLVPGGLKLNTS